VTLVGFTLLYGVLMAVDVYLLVKFARPGAAQLEMVDDGVPTAPAEA